MNPTLRLAFLSLVLTFLSHSTFAQGYDIKNYDITINVEEDGELQIQEKIDVFFHEKKRGIYKNIPFLYKINGRKYKIKISDIEVIGHEKKISTNGPERVIRIGSPDVFLEGDQEYNISYNLDKVILQYENHQELYLDLIPHKREAPIEKINFEINFPEKAGQNIKDVKITSGRYGSTDSDVNFEINDNGNIKGQSSRPYNEGEGITAAVSFPIGTFADLRSFGDMQTIGIDKEKNKPWYIGIPLLVIGAFLSWWRRWRYKARRRNIEDQYYPPEGRTSAIVGAYIDHKVHSRDVISLIPYWATEGIVTITGMEDGDMVIFKKNDLPKSFPDYEHKLFDAIFEDRHSISLTEANMKFGPVFYQTKRAITKELEDSGFYDDRYVSLFKSWQWPLLCVLLIIGGVFLAAFSGYIIFGIGVVLFAMIGLILLFFSAPLSEYGLDVHEHIKGLEQFLKYGNEAKINELSAKDPDYFGKMLPYAVAFGLDKQWVKKFETLHTSAPYWFYMDHHTGRPTFSNFSESFKIEEIQSAFSSYNYSDSSGGSSSGGAFSGSGGGGFSGGGFGGGSMGSW